MIFGPVSFYNPESRSPEALAQYQAVAAAFEAICERLIKGENRYFCLIRLATFIAAKSDMLSAEDRAHFRGVLRILANIY